LRAAAAAALRPEATRVITFKDLLKVRAGCGCLSVVWVSFVGIREGRSKIVWAVQM
jgi:hypothetical protein